MLPPARASSKPSHRVLECLIHGEWETHECLVTDGEGFLSFTGFMGNYSLKNENGTASVELKGPLDRQVRLEA